MFPAPDALAITVHLLDAVLVITQGIEEAQSLDVDTVVSTLENMDKIETCWGTGTMGGADLIGVNHIVVRPFMMSHIENGTVEFEFVK